MIEEVKTKIKPTKNAFGPFSIATALDEYPTQMYSRASVLGYSSEECPRCGSYGFSLDDSNLDVFSVTAVTSSIYSTNRTSNLYKCRKCGLELTKKEYEIAKKLKS